MTTYSPKTNALAANAVLEAAVADAVATIRTGRALAAIHRYDGKPGRAKLREANGLFTAEATLLAAAQSAELLLERA